MSQEWPDPYTIPGTSVLINKLGIKTFDALRRAEYDLTRQRVQELQLQPIQGRFDLKHLQDFHRHIFQDLYEWAGRLRTGDILKDGHRFVPMTMLREYGNRVFAALANENFLRGLGKPKFLAKLTKYYAQINTLHPFREGNGRATQAFLSDLAGQAGYSIDYTKVDKGRWNESARASFVGNLEPMQGVFEALVSPARAVAFDRMPQAEAVQRHPELKPAYVRLAMLRDEVGHLGPEKHAQVEAAARSVISKALHEDLGLDKASSLQRSGGELLRGLER